MVESVIIDPELRDWILPLSTEERENLEKSIKEDGCRDPLIVWNGILVDGHHRYEICTRNNLPYHTVNKDFSDKDAAKVWMVSNQLARRNLQPLQMVLLVQKAAPLIAAKAKERQATSTGGCNPQLVENLPQADKVKSRDDLGAMAKMSGRTYEKGVTVLERAAPEIVQKVMSGDVSIHKAYTDIKKVEKDTARREELAQKTTAAQALPDTITLHHADFLTEYTRIEKASVDAIITDPPYVKEWLENYADFAIAAEYVLKPGGFLVAYVGHIHLDKILAQMTPYLDYYWIMTILHAGHLSAVHSKGVECAMKPILVFQKSPKTMPKRYFKDVIDGSGREKDAHEWQQGEEELRQIFEPFTDPGDLVLDPFMGSGTTLAMAKKMNRRVIGFDIDETNVAITRGRLMPAQQSDADPLNVQLEPEPVIEGVGPGVKSCQAAAAMSAIRGGT